VLDVGCGTGYNVSMLEKLGYCIKRRKPHRKTE
jgi:protein-L-isoaspartate O-methyltransferase